MLKMLNLALRFILELLALAALGYWGFSTGAGWALKLLLGLGVPLAAAVVWGAFIAPKAHYPPVKPVRLLLEALVFGSAAAGLALAGQPTLGLTFAAVVIVHELLRWLWKQD